MNEPISETDPTKPTRANPHTLWRQVAGLVIWTGIFGFFAGGIVGALVTLLIGGTTFADAWRSGIYKDPDKKSFLNISPMSWGIAMGLLFIVAFPTYALNRKELATIQGGNGFFIATIIIGIVWVLLFIVQQQLGYLNDFQLSI